MQLPFTKCLLESHPSGSVTQFFGENATLYRRWGLEGHNGVDLVAPHGTPMYAVEDAVVHSVKLNPDGYGKYLRLRTDTREWTYGHCSSIRVVEGEKVKAGDYIADMGNTGFVISGATPFWKTNPFAGTHLHLGLRLLKDGVVQNYTNGFKGAVDPLPYLMEGQVPTKRQQMLTLISILNTLVKLLKIKRDRMVE